MPELPEVETIRQTLRKKIINKRIIDVDIRYKKIIKTDYASFRKNIINQTITEIERKGKYLLIKLNDYYLISHLRMEGKYFLCDADKIRNKHDHIVFIFSDNKELRYNDVRKFGTMHLKRKNEVFKGEPLSKLGIEPFEKDFTIEYLKNKLKGKRSIKNALLDQRVIAGLGNIYVDEVLFLSKLHPETSLDYLNDEDYLNIINASKTVLEKAIKLGGTTIRSYYSDDGITGRFQNELVVHNQKDKGCINCGDKIIKIKVGGRGTYLCPTCQINQTNVDKT